MTLTFWLFQLVNGVSFGMLLFLLAAGLSLIFGLMRIVNLAHGSFYLLGAYLALTVLRATHSFPLALLAAGVGVALLGAAVQHWLLRRFYRDELAQVLLTFGLLFMLGDLAAWAWGGTPQALPTPAALQGAVSLGGLWFPVYRLAVIAVGLAVAAGLALLLNYTTLGAVVRAGVDDVEMVRGVGINVDRVFTGVFALGALLAALAGVVGGPFLGVYPGADLEVLLLAFVVVILGGLGSLKGAFVGSLGVGLLDNLGKALFPELALFTLFAPMVVVLVVRPTGLFGKS